MRGVSGVETMVADLETLERLPQGITMVVHAASTSSRFMLCSKPLLTATSAESRRAPVAKALGESEGKIATSGMPIPAAAGQLAAVVFFFPEPVTGRYQALLLMVLVVSLAFLMVSTLRYPSFKGVDLKSRRNTNCHAEIGVLITP